MRITSVFEGVTIAFHAVVTQKLRSGLTILGIVIGVATVMAMASIVQGLRKQIIDTVEVAGPTTFYVIRFFSQTPLNPDNLPREVRIRVPSTSSGWNRRSQRLLGQKMLRARETPQS